MIGASATGLASPARPGSPSSSCSSERLGDRAGSARRAATSRPRRRTKSWSTGATLLHSSACQAWRRARRTRATFAAASGASATAAPSALGEPHLGGPSPLDAPRPLHDPDLRPTRSRHLLVHRLSVRAPVRAAVRRSTHRRAPTANPSSDTAIPTRMIAAPATRSAPSRSPLTKPAMPANTGSASRISAARRGRDAAVDPRAAAAARSPSTRCR